MISNFKFITVACLTAGSFTLAACGEKSPAPKAVEKTAAVAPTTPIANPDVVVAVTDAACEPASLTVPAGKTTFIINNKSSRPLEFEILKGVLVVEERENIAPSFTQKLTATLEAGEYDMTCGLLSNPRGKLTVTPNASAQAAAIPVVQLEAPIAQYKAYVLDETKSFVAKTEAFVAAVNAGDMNKAKSLYAPTRAHYERIEPIAELFADLDASIDARADAYKKVEKDPEFTGFHRLEYALWSEKSLKGMKPIADQLLTDVKALQTQITELNFPATKVVGGAGVLIEEVANGKISGEEERYSHTDLSDFDANMAGSKKIVDLFRPLIEKADPSLLKKTDENFAAVDAILSKYKQGETWALYDKLTEADRKALAAPITVLAEDLSKLRGLLGLN